MQHESIGCLEHYRWLYIAASQRGLVTSAQALSAGMGRMELSCLAANGHLERVSRAVYRTSGAPSMHEETVWATWLSLEPAALAHSRDPLACAVSHNTAAWLMGLGELDPEPLSNMCSQRVSRGGAMCHGGHMCHGYDEVPPPRDAANLPCAVVSGGGRIIPCEPCAYRSGKQPCRGS